MFTKKIARKNKFFLCLLIPLYSQSRKVNSPPRLGKKRFFVNYEILGFRFGGKNMWITTKLKTQQNSVDQIFNPNEFFSSF